MQSSISELDFDCISSYRSQAITSATDKIAEDGQLRNVRTINRNKITTTLRNNQVDDFNDEFSTEDEIPLAELRKTWIKDTSQQTDALKISSTDSSDNNIPLACKVGSLWGRGGKDEKQGFS